MQTFSYLQRSGHDEKNLLKGALLIAALGLYEPLTTIYPYLPLLLGLAFWRIFVSSWVVERAVWLSYLYLFGIDHQIPILALIFAIVASYYLLRRLLSYLLCTFCVRLLGVVLFYVLFVAILAALFWILQIQWHPMWEIFWLYLLADLIVVGLYAK